MTKKVAMRKVVELTAIKIMDLLAPLTDDEKLFLMSASLGLVITTQACCEYHAWMHLSRCEQQVRRSFADTLAEKFK
jgi:hypothetical protein